MPISADESWLTSWTRYFRGIALTTPAENRRVNPFGCLMASAMPFHGLKTRFQFIDSALFIVWLRPLLASGISLGQRICALEEHLFLAQVLHCRSNRKPDRLPEFDYAPVSLRFGARLN